MDRNAMNEILRKHKLWLDGMTGGERADFRNKDLRWIDLDDTILCKADFRGADLQEARICRANLCGADFRGANLHYALLIDANLTDLKVDDTTKWFALHCPAEGAYIGYKKCRGDLIVELEIPADAKRSSATSEKCRASKAKVISITNLDGSHASIEEIESIHDCSFIYRIGKTITVPDFDEDRWRCSTGIYHFISRQEAVNYIL